jgi:hypothetical protein
VAGNGRFTRTQALADAALVPHAFRLELRGAPRSLTWPDRCANCGAPAVERLPVAKAFYPQIRWGSHAAVTRGYHVVRADIPVCAACAERHRATIRAQSVFARYRTFILNPVHIATIGLLALLWLVGPSLADMSSPAQAPWLGTAIIGAFAAGIAWTIALAWWTTRPDRFPPVSEITSACDFSQDVSQLFERERHIYRIRNAQFADALATLNRDRVWTDADQASVPWRALAGLIALLAALGLARLLLGG